jgi:two-component system sensor histidine kinase PilS (NtrC family)
MGSRFFRASMSATETQSAFMAENWKLLQSFNFYRLLLAATATGLALSGESVPPFGTSAPRLFEVVGLTYCVVALAAIYTILKRWPAFESHATFLAFADITLLTLLMHASQGLGSGIGLLLLVAVAGASLMLGTRLTVLFAALATIAIGIEVNWAFLTEGEWTASRWNTDGYTQMGFLGIGLFATAGLTHVLARRLRATEALAQQRGVDLANLAQVNEVIIQRMHSGVLVCDLQGTVHMLNKTAQGFLGLPAKAGGKNQLIDISAQLDAQFRHWQGRTSDSGRRVIETRTGYTLLPRFVPVGERRDDNGVLVFLEDTAAIRQQAAQLKIAALARLTASIAHEIRNPLGAIAHAAQLLAESASQNTDETRLLRIIQDQSRRMNVIIENVTQLSRRDKINPVRVQLGFWVKDFIQQFTANGAQPPEAFQTMGLTDLPVCVDPDQLYQVIGNLCQNALRHSPEFSGQALVALKSGHDQEKRPYLEVVDWGSGVPAEVVENIFDPFFTTTPKGTGLGLYIARELCEGNGGKLEYFPGDQGVGSRFRVTFARAEECGEFATVGAL